MVAEQCGAVDPGRHQPLGHAVVTAARLQRQGVEHRLGDVVASHPRCTPDLLDEQLRDLGVELRPGPLDQRLARLLGRPRGAVGALVRHRAVRLEHREHPRAERDVLAAQPGRVARAVDALVVVEHRHRDIVQRGRLAEHVEPQPRMQLDQRPLVGRQLARAQPRPLGQRQVADRPQQRGADQHVALALVELEVLGEQARVDRELARLPVQDRVVRRDRLGEHADRRPARVAELVLEPVVLKRRPGVVTEREQQLVADILEAARPVGADDHAVEAIAQVERDRHERVDLAVGGRGLAIARARRVVVAQDLVAGQHRAGEALRDGAVRRIVLEALRADDVELPVAVLVLARDEHPLVGLDELDRGAEDQAVQVVALGEHAALGLEPLDLRPQLAVPLALGLPGLAQPVHELRLLLALRLEPADVALEPLALLALRLSRLLGGGGRARGVGQRPPPADDGERDERQQCAGAGQRDRGRTGTGHQPYAQRHHDDGGNSGGQHRAARLPARLFHQSPFLVGNDRPTRFPCESPAQRKTSRLVAASRSANPACPAIFGWNVLGENAGLSRSSVTPWSQSRPAEQMRWFL